VYSYRARWYLPEAGVFAERDPVGPDQGANLYSYLDQDPANARDPLGLESEWDRWAGESVQHSREELRRLGFPIRTYEYYNNQAFGVFLTRLAAAVKDQPTYRDMLMGGEYEFRFDTSWIGAGGQGSGKTKYVFLGTPDTGKDTEYNATYQRLRLYQVAKIIDDLRAWGSRSVIEGMSDTEFHAHYQLFHHLESKRLYPLAAALRLKGFLLNDVLTAITSAIDVAARDVAQRNRAMEFAVHQLRDLFGAHVTGRPCNPPSAVCVAVD